MNLMLNDKNIIHLQGKLTRLDEPFKNLRETTEKVELKEKILLSNNLFVQSIKKEKRIQQITNHLIGNPSRKSSEDVVVVAAAVLDKSKIDSKLIQDVAVGNVLPPGGGATVARAAALFTGIPDTADLNTVNRQCSSGLQAVVQIAHEIVLDQIEIGIAMATDVSEKVFSNPASQDCLLPMGATSENVAEEFGVTRAKQDQFAVLSHQKAAAAQKSGLFKEEIIPVRTKWIDPKTGDEKEIVVDKDDGIRKNTTLEGLAKLKPALKENGTTTAAAAVLLMKRKTAERLRLPIIGRFIRASVVGFPLRVMGIGPAYAIPTVLKLVGLSVNDIVIYEINEAFASQAIYSIEKLGHPLGCTGARQVSTLLTELRRTRKKLGVISMCIGTGMGMSAVFEAEFA
ncbi:6485_t:CDS:2 [Entrophospora sp. SA101]|nr:6485_t:CDS:2 [Entrophospora sp. SA101]